MPEHRRLLSTAVIFSRRAHRASVTGHHQLLCSCTVGFQGSECVPKQSSIANNRVAYAHYQRRRLLLPNRSSRPTSGRAQRRTPSLQSLGDRHGVCIPQRDGRGKKRYHELHWTDDSLNFVTAHKRLQRADRARTRSKSRQQQPGADKVWLSLVAYVVLSRGCGCT